MLLGMSHTKANEAALKQLSSCMIRIIRNGTLIERGELPGCELAGKMWKYVFPGSCAVIFFGEFCPCPQPGGFKADLWGQGVQLPSCQDCCCSAGWQFCGNHTADQHVLPGGIFGSWEGGGELRSKVPVLGPRALQGLPSLNCQSWSAASRGTSGKSSHPPSWAPSEPMQNLGKANISYPFAASLDCGKALQLPCQLQGSNQGRPPVADLCPSTCRGTGRAPAVPGPGGRSWLAWVPGEWFTGWTLSYLVWLSVEIFRDWVN